VTGAGVLLHGGAGADGRPLDVRCDPGTGIVTDAGERLEPRSGDELHDCRGMVVLAAPAEPHAHLDKALSGDRAPNPEGDLEGAIVAWHAQWPRLTEEDIAARARAAVDELVAHGTTAIRTHVDVGPTVGLRAVDALVAVRDDLAREGLADLQIVALASVPLTGADGAAVRELLEAAIAAGADVVGGCPHLDPDPTDCTAVAVAAAAAHDLPLDLHVDETLDPAHLWLPALIDEVAAHGLGGRAVASHCVSLGVQDVDVQRAVAARAAAAGVAVVTLPQTNLFLQARGVAVAPPRGLTAVRALLDAGCVLAAGADNVRDPFCLVGRCDALETAALLVMAAHLTPDEAWHAVSGAARTAIGLPPAGPQPGAAAELLAVRGSSLSDAIARASERRLVVHRGRVVARTHVASRLIPSPNQRPLAAGPAMT
jgi:cytosine deaminase